MRHPPVAAVAGHREERKTAGSGGMIDDIKGGTHKSAPLDDHCNMCVKVP